MKPQNLDIEKAKLAAGLPPEEELIQITSHVKSGDRVLDLRGGMGLLAEHLSARGAAVVLHEEERLVFSYRRNILTNGTSTTQWNVPIGSIIINKPVFEHVIIRTFDDMALAKKAASKSIINLYTMEITYVEHNSEKSEADTKVE